MKPEVDIAPSGWPEVLWRACKTKGTYGVRLVDGTSIEFVSSRESNNGWVLLMVEKMQLTWYGRNVGLDNGIEVKVSDISWCFEIPPVANAIVGVGDTTKAIP